MTLNEILDVLTEAERERLSDEHGEAIAGAVNAAIAEGMEHDDAWNLIGAAMFRALVSGPVKANAERLRERAGRVEHGLRVNDALRKADPSPAGIKAALHWHLRTRDK